MSLHYTHVATKKSFPVFNSRPSIVGCSVEYHLHGVVLQELHCLDLNPRWPLPDCVTVGGLLNQTLVQPTSLVSVSSSVKWRHYSHPLHGGLLRTKLTRRHSHTSAFLSRSVPSSLLLLLLLPTSGHKPESFSVLPSCHFCKWASTINSISNTTSLDFHCHHPSKATIVSSHVFFISLITGSATRLPCSSPPFTA